MPRPAVVRPTIFAGAIAVSTEQIRQTAPIVIAGKALVALNVGDCVIMDPLDTGKVTKSAVAGDITKCIGVVVGGARLDTMPINVVIDQGLVNKLAANAGETVTIAISGIVFCIADAAIPVVGSLVSMSAGIAGRVVLAAAPAPGAVVGKTLRVANAAANVVEVLIAHM